MALDMCGDNRFEIISSAKKELLEATNIENSKEEMAVLDNILFRMWQMGWLPDCNNTKPVVHGKWIIGEHAVYCSECNHISAKILVGTNYCSCCGADMRRINES